MQSNNCRLQNRDHSRRGEIFHSSEVLDSIPTKFPLFAEFNSIHYPSFFVKSYFLEHFPKLELNIREMLSAAGWDNSVISCKMHKFWARQEAKAVRVLSPLDRKSAEIGDLLHTEGSEDLLLHWWWWHHVKGRKGLNMSKNASFSCLSRSCTCKENRTKSSLNKKSH